MRPSWISMSRPALDCTPSKPPYSAACMRQVNRCDEHLWHTHQRANIHIRMCTYFVAHSNAGVIMLAKLPGDVAQYNGYHYVSYRPHPQPHKADHKINHIYITCFRKPPTWEQ